MKENHLVMFGLLAVSLAITPNAQAQRKKKDDKVDFAKVWETQNVEVSASPVTRKAPEPGKPPQALEMSEGMHIGFVGGGLGSRMNEFSEFETELQRRFPDLNLYIRNLCHEGDTPAFRPHPSRGSYVVVPGTEALLKPEYQSQAKSEGHYETPDQWLARHKVDTVIGFFGYGESFEGRDRLDDYKQELRAFIDHSLKQKYSGLQIQLAIVGPHAFEDLSGSYDLPNGEKENQHLAMYSAAMAEVCKEAGVLFVDAFEITKNLYQYNDTPLTINGHNLTRNGYRQMALNLADSLFEITAAQGLYNKTLSAVAAKNKLWVMDYKIPNGVHVYGRRFAPYGDKNYPTEIRKIREMTHIRDRAIWAINQGESYDVANADQDTTPLLRIETNSTRPNEYKSGEAVGEILNVAEGFKVELFASEDQFPDLKNPSQMAFDNQGRLWVSCMGTYPHYRIGDRAPDDKIIILEDTDGDYKADSQITFVDKIHIPMGFEITEKGVFVSLGKNLVLLQDTDGDSKADKRTIVLSGFDDHDTHHAISSFCADPSGAIFMGEGVFLHSNVETPYGTVRGTDGGFYRYNPNKMHLERTCQINIPNPWGIAFDDWGQNFFLYTSNPAMGWMQQAAIKPKFARNLKGGDLLTSQKVRPTSGLEFVSSRHFPDEMQGDVLICNNIGFLGCKQHKLVQDENGFYNAEFRQDLFYSPKEYQYFRPVDLEFAPDGSLYFVDWSNVLIGHMQHSARDPKRDKVHGRVYRLTYPSRPLVKPVQVAGASISQLLENLKEPENRTRYRTRRELRGRDAVDVVAATRSWVAGLDKELALYDRHLLEALWVTWGINQIDQSILEKTSYAEDYRARAAAVRAARYNADKVANLRDLMLKASSDSNALVRHEAVIAASWLGGDLGREMIVAIESVGIDKAFTGDAFKFAKGDLTGVEIKVIDNSRKALSRGIISESSEEIQVQVNCVHEGLKFDFEEFKAKIGQRIKIVFNNPDVMQHNLVVVKPGTDVKVAGEALGLGAEGFSKHFVPDSTDVIAASKLLESGQKEVLSFTLDEAGIYPYICSFPGHAQPMRGVIVVE